MIVIASANGDVGIDAAWEIIAQGGSALDAVEAGVRLVEDNPDDHTVGYSGYPNVLGQVQLDASIMNGATRAAGAVGSLEGYRSAITVARAVMERLPHVLVVGEGASKLAEEIGLQEEDLLTPAAKRVWQEGLDQRLGDLQTQGTLVDRVHGVIGEIFDPELTRSTAARLQPPGGTVNFLACDRDGHLASAVSTSGWAWKYPGRLGDSPIIGAGNYCDDRYGAAACTGWGELTTRAGTARNIVAGLASGLALGAACEAALTDLAGLEPNEPGTHGYVNLIALDRSGHHFAASTKEGTEYVWRADGMSQAERTSRHVVSV
jgi:L-asparaginase / beta-aspartyl-peptidase